MFPSLYGVVSQGGAADWWAVTGKTCVAAYQPIGAASLAASYTNLANSGTNNAAPGTAPTWASATGWVFNGSTQYLTTGVVPADGWSAICRYSNRSSTAGYVMGIGQTVGQYFGFIPTASNVIYGLGGTISVAPALDSGVVAISGQRAYRNGSVDGGTISSWSGTTSLIIYIGAANRGVPNNYFAGNIQAIAIYSDTLSGAEVAAVSAAMAALT